ncbi:hypothetical protein SNE40_018496 [Patella caerulea]|uniref:Rho GTPase n=1 Tax=Patella caerulea TaxID=87958 RepID=A0AAN8PGM5_PATCE
MFKCLRRQESTQECVNRKKIILVGDGECGKTCLLQRFSHGTFSETCYLATLFEVETIPVEHENKQVELVLCDTAGQSDYSRLRPISYPGTDVVIICFSLDHSDSLENVETIWWPEISHFCKGVPILLVGTKKDLRDQNVPRNSDSMVDGIDELIEKGDLCVKFEKGQAIADKIGAVGYLECSAKLNDGVETIFTEATRVALTMKRKKKRGW